MAAAPTLAWLFVGRLIAGIAGATYGPANAVLADVTPPEKRGATFRADGRGLWARLHPWSRHRRLACRLWHADPFHCRSGLGGSECPVDRGAASGDLVRREKAEIPLAGGQYLRCIPPTLPCGGRRALLVAAVALGSSATSSIPPPGHFQPLHMAGRPAQVGWSLGAAGLAMAVVQAGLTGKVIARVGEAKAAVIGMTVGGLSFPSATSSRTGTGPSTPSSSCRRCRVSSGRRSTPCSPA